MFDLRDLYQQVIVDHNKSPRNFGKLADFNHEADGYNPLCGDKLHVYLKVNDAGVIEDVSFEGEGCAISVASASLMTDALKGKTMQESEDMFGHFQHMATSELDEAPDEEVLGKLTVLAGVREFPSRIKCATLCWHTLLAAVKDRPEPAKTE
ncbi:MAG: SUF system NifU family Fe-S cluster assembly protein [Zetaproteobacteria bacterium CG12_big_fil_rev_8_21_14_0_65_55_1124]|nr:MAG: SUF system NifU family Fe-S cluster assembly protein [Zetaproteobacteria bacterium CG1_02_55_237]PIS20127.1 MAG: SUF system NifU family Fe-S cluster assembly protein [Zetaproteobacteria bacterium CG08_land_8_20_14_0_20_55_17]PIW43190.1 MAG: SUF system NifU family Fe-S cluster assembly protein [Zetaproteobacteria bacterium CG12_big_fil_rev_8_21_14_0_65_55_1124]PIY53186.1 MAG: SUF system NifU family Fe-S cluster assembly protein [Zetaproteobacteria bacterium CG_4_10_14_0_8_um_filter_55_43]